MNKWLSLGLYAFLSLIALNLITSLFSLFFLGALIYLFVKILYLLMVIGLTVGILVAIKEFVFKDN